MWIPEAARVGTKAVQNAEATASLEPIAVDRSEDPGAHPVVLIVVVRSEDPEAPLMVPNAVARSVDLEAPLVVPVVVARSEDPEAPLVVPIVAARNVDPVVPLAEDTAVEVVRPFSIIYPRRLRPPFFMAWGDGSAIAVYVGLAEV